MFIENYEHLDLRLKNNENSIYGIIITENEVDTEAVNLSEEINLNTDSIVDPMIEAIIDTVSKIDLAEESTEQ